MVFFFLNQWQNCIEDPDLCWRPRFLGGDGMSMLIRQSAWIFGDSAPMGRKEGVGGSSIRAAKKLDKCFWLGLAGSQALFKSLKLLGTI